MNWWRASRNAASIKRGVHNLPRFDDACEYPMMRELLQFFNWRPKVGPIWRREAIAYLRHRLWQGQKSGETRTTKLFDWWKLTGKNVSANRPKSSPGQSNMSSLLGPVNEMQISRRHHIRHNKILPRWALKVSYLAPPRPPRRLAPTTRTWSLGNST